ncbi:hypothetical protein Osc7112_5828 [Oscillatoria nigro-viridis PCC 7112]|uniref:Uncharacterized protein n=1 Tax=Phormidium nigroviride PCC 7112 TaxID=179408 RepID=K9VQ42_9CYAN|nr:hypothetical protein Osc7112_5828 [Oscillatoria nigro-viridis PCC 7112]
MAGNSELEQKSDGSRKKKEAIQSIVSAINNLLTVLAVAIIYSNRCRSRKFFSPPQPSPSKLGVRKKFTNDARIAIDKALASCGYLQKWLPTLTPIAKIEDLGMENFC